MDDMFNRLWASHELRELRDDVDRMIEEINEGHYDDDSGDMSFPMALDHLKDHIVLAWQFSRMTDEQISSASEEDFEKWTSAIPRFNPNVEYRLVDLDED